MDKLKSLLLPLALVFGAIAVFEIGARYGAANMRAYAIAGELRLPLSIYVQSQSTTAPQHLESLTVMIDGGIAAGATHRQLWYLDKKAKTQLEKVLGYALSVRGDAVLETYTRGDEDAPALQGLSEAKLAEIRAAIKEAKRELVDAAPGEAQQEATDSTG